MSNKDVCRSDFRGDGSIPKELAEDWEKFIVVECKSTACGRRYVTHCCRWGKFAEKMNLNK